MWTHIKETWKSALLALCEGNPSVTGEVPTKGPAAANAEKLPFEDVIVAWFEFVIKWGTHTIICFSIHITPSNISSLIRELHNHNCCVKSSPLIRASQVLHQNLLRARRLIRLCRRISGGCRASSSSFKEAIVGTVGITPTCFFHMPCCL